MKCKFFGTWGRSQNALWIQLGNQSYTLASLSIILIILGVCRAISSGHLSARQALKRSSPHKVRGGAWIQSNTSMSVLLLILLSFASLFFCILWQWNLQCNLTHPIQGQDANQGLAQWSASITQRRLLVLQCMEAPCCLLILCLQNLQVDFLPLLQWSLAQNICKLAS